MLKEGKKRKFKDIHPESAPHLVISEEFFNRELSWLEFNRRVLHEAKDDRIPLLERVKFLSIFTSNLDEFFMNRVGGLKQKLRAGLTVSGGEGLSGAHLISSIRTAVASLVAEQAECYEKSIKPALEKHGIFIHTWDELTEEQRAQATRYFQSNVFPVLTPQAVDPGRPFPFISNLSQSLGVALKHPERDEPLFARVKIPPALPQLIRLEDKQNAYRYISLRNLIQHNIHRLFAGMAVQNVMPFRITRNAEIELDEDEADDLLELIKEELRERKFAQVVRLEHSRNPDPWMLRFLMDEIELTEEDCYEIPAELDYTNLREIGELNISGLSPDPWIPVTLPPLADEEANFFSLIKSSDVLVHHPYESYTTSVERFLRAAIDDPKVLAIKVTLYRTGDKSTIVPLLIRAAEKEKHVVCLIELKAHFDEARNIQWAQALEEAGVYVMYGVVGLKTHAKLILVARQEPDGVRCYAHIGTGNYNASTARVYTDLGLFTSNSEICEDLVELFHFLTGRSLQREYRRLLVAPFNMRDRFLKMVDREIDNRNAGMPSGIIMKANSLEDVSMCRALYKASQAGVESDLLVRGLCCLRPGLDPISKNIRVISVIGRFLEHSRIFYFRNGAADPLDGEFYMGSADWMHRNLSRRVEVVVPILDRQAKEKCWEILQLMINDQREGWELQSNGNYVQRNSTRTDLAGAQSILMRLTRDRGRGTPARDDHN